MTEARSKPVQGFPKVITDLPKADIQMSGIKAWILQGPNQQLVFFEMESIAKVPEHSHTYAQWGMVVEGEMKLTINGKARLCKRGDEYVIPAQAKHYATFLAKTRVMDFFSEKTRYRAKQTK